MGCSGSKSVIKDEIGGLSSTGGAVDLRRGLVWIQEKNFEDKFRVVRIIGKGSIGEVAVVRRKTSLNSSRHRKELSGGVPPSRSLEYLDDKDRDALPPDNTTGKQERLYALKSIHVNRMSRSMVREFENEVEILQQLHHPNIIQLREVFYYKKKIYMLMNLCTGGQLNQRDFSEEMTCSVVSQVLRALVYMHDTARICHRDLKMENIMLESPEDPLVVKLIDFGLSQVFTKGDKMRTACGTVYTMAPEVLTGAGYTQKADLWSLGVITFALLSGDLPFLKDEADLTNKEEVERLAQARFQFSNPRWQVVTKESKEFVRGLLKKLPGFRFTAREALDNCADVWGPALVKKRLAMNSGEVGEGGDTAVPTPAEGTGGVDGLGDGTQTGTGSGDESACGSGGENGGGVVAGEGGKRPQSPTTAPQPSPWSPSWSDNRDEMGAGGGGHCPSSPLGASRAPRVRQVPQSIATSLRRFADYGELKKAALMITAFQLGREEIKQLKDAFLEVDTTGNGVITCEELRDVLRDHGVEQSEVDRVFGAVDMDQTGRLHYMEFLAATVEARGYIEEERLEEAFERLDVDGSGFITPQDLKVVLGPAYDDALINAMIEEGSQNSSGKIDWEEFLSLMRPMVEQDYHNEALSYLAEEPEEARAAAEVERRAVNQAPTYHSSRAYRSGGSVRQSFSEGRHSWAGDMMSGFQTVALTAARAFAAFDNNSPRHSVNVPEPSPPPTRKSTE